MYLSAYSAYLEGRNDMECCFLWGAPCLPSPPLDKPVLGFSWKETLRSLYSPLFPDSRTLLHDLNHTYQPYMMFMACSRIVESREIEMSSCQLQCHIWVGWFSVDSILPSPSLGLCKIVFALQQIDMLDHTVSGDSSWGTLLCHPLSGCGGIVSWIPETNGLSWNPDFRRHFLLYFQQPYCLPVGHHCCSKE